MDSTKIFLLIIGNIINIALSLIFFYLIRILFVVEIVGYYGVILSFLTTFSLINDLGIQLAYLKFYGEAKNSNEEALYNGTFLTYRIFQFVIYVILILTFIPLAPTYNGDTFVGYYFFIAMIFFRVEFFEHIFLSKKEVFKSSISSLVMMLLRNFLLILSIFFFESNIWLLMNIILISNISHFILSLFLIRKRKFKKPNKELINKFFKYSFPFFFTNSLIFIVSNVDVLLINAWSPIANVANYYTAKQFFYYFLIISNSISNVLITTFSKNISIGKEKENYEIIKYTHRFLNLIILPIIFFVYLYAPSFFVVLFGEQYRLTGQILFYFVLLLIPISLDVGNVVQLQASGKIRFIAKFSVLEHVLSILLMIFFISPAFLNLGVFGGALAYLISKIITQLIYRPIIYKKFNLGFYWGSFRNFFIMLGIFLFQLWINSSFVFPIYFIPLFMIMDIILYLLINYLFKGFTMNDFKFLLRIINIKIIYDSIVSELKGSDKVQIKKKKFIEIKFYLKKLYNKFSKLVPLKYDYNSELERAIKGCNTILDVGCGSDSPIKQFSKNLYCVGVDLYAAWLDKSKEKEIHNKYYQMDVKLINKEFKEDSFDCVLALDLIEHLEKQEGEELLYKMEKIAKKKVIVFTPNGFVPQSEKDGNPWEVHRSGWSVKEMKEKGYYVIGINGLKFLKGEYGLIKYRPRFFWFVIAQITQLIVRNWPQKAFQILCIKEK